MLKNSHFVNFWSNQGNLWRLTAYCNIRLMTRASDFEWQHPLYIYNTGIILGSNLWYQNKEINYRILINYVRVDITEEFFRITVEI